MNTLPKRKSIRLKGYDYGSEGAYFVTICTHDKKCTLSRIRRDDPCGRPRIELTELGKVADEAVSTIENKYKVTISDCSIMPNHIHLIIFIPKGRTRASPVPTLSKIVGSYKSIIAVDYLSLCKSRGIVMGSLWQNKFYDHIIRDEDDYLTKAQYIENNPAKWIEDKYYIKDI